MKGIDYTEVFLDEFNPDKPSFVESYKIVRQANGIDVKEPIPLKITPKEKET